MTAAAPLIQTTSPLPGATLVAQINEALGAWYYEPANDTGGSNVNTAQPWFPTSGSISLTAGTTYYFQGRLYATRSAGTTSHTTAVLFGGTATITSLVGHAEARTGDANALSAYNGFRMTSASGVVVKAASTSATEDLDAFAEGFVQINAAGTLIPQFQYSVAPGGTPTILTGSYFFICPRGLNGTDMGAGWAAGI